MNYITFPLTKKRLFYFCKLCVLTLSGRMSRKKLCCDWHQFARFRTVMTHYYVLTYHFKKVGVKQEKKMQAKKLTFQCTHLDLQINGAGYCQNSINLLNKLPSICFLQLLRNIGNLNFKECNFSIFSFFLQMFTIYCSR